jgi:putative proteasome-type protease
MTFCLGMKVKDGLIGIADTRITTASECITAKKVSIHRYGRYPMFLMTSGLRSVRDKALTYFSEVMDDNEHHFDKLYKAVNEFGKQIRRVAEEDREALKQSGLDFNIHALIGGQLERDKGHKLFLLYPEGNWVEIGEGTPYHIIGSARYGKPVLDRALRFESAMDFALKVGYLAFDATFMSATDVAFPIDVVMYRNNTHDIIERRFEKDDFEAAASAWQDHIVQSIQNLPMGQLDSVFAKVLEQPMRPSHTYSSPMSAAAKLVMAHSSGNGGTSNGSGNGSNDAPNGHLHNEIDNSVSQQRTPRLQG